MSMSLHVVCFSLEYCSIWSGLCLGFVWAPFGWRPGSNRAWSWTRLKQLWLQLTRGETLVFAACFFEKEPENQLKKSGKQSLVRHKALELLMLLRTIDAVVPDTFFFFLFLHLPSSSSPPYLPHLESIKQLWKEGENLTTANVFSMPGKVRGTPFIRLKHPCWIFWGLFLFFGGKFLKPLNQSFTLTNLLHPLPPFFSSKHAAVCCCCCYSSSAGGHKGKVPYHTPEINRE